MAKTARFVARFLILPLSLAVVAAAPSKDGESRAAGRCHSLQDCLSQAAARASTLQALHAGFAQHARDLGAENELLRNSCRVSLQRDPAIAMPTASARDRCPSGFNVGEGAKLDSDSAADPPHSPMISAALPSQILRGGGTNAAVAQKQSTAATEETATVEEDRSYEYDYFVIGGGSGGVRSARIAATYGARVALAELASGGDSAEVREKRGGLGGNLVAW